MSCLSCAQIVQPGLSVPEALLQIIEVERQKNVFFFFNKQNVPSL